jgi:hypothetical protein
VPGQFIQEITQGTVKLILYTYNIPLCSAPSYVVHCFPDDFFYFSGKSKVTICFITCHVGTDVG